MLTLPLSLCPTASLIGWTRQIKEVVNEKDSFDSPDSGPLAEIEFWRFVRAEQQCVSHDATVSFAVTLMLNSAPERMI